jgi:hypothetical protein
MKNQDNLLEITEDEEAKMKLQLLVKLPAYKANEKKFNNYIEWRTANSNGTYEDYRKATK